MKRIFVSLVLVFLFIYLFLPSVFASGFSTAYLRLESKANSAISATVCGQPSSAGAGTENKVIVTFPDDFTISTNASNWIVSTSDIPSGSTPWPLIGGTATSASSQSVTFSSNDLTLNTLYCFNLSSTLSSAGSSGNDKTGTIATKNSSNVLIDSTTYGLSVLNNNQVNVTASVDPQISDLPIDIQSLTPGTDFSQDSTISYKITYGSNTAGSIPLTIQAQWTEGTIEGSPAPSVEILDYVVGSATSAYASTPAVIDTVNKTITWTIPLFPSNTTGKTVTFSLKTNSAYTGPEKVDFNVSARAISGTTVTPDVTVSQDYLFDATLVTPTPTPTPGSSGGSNTTSTTPTPTPALQNFSISAVSINSVSQSDAQILVTTSTNTAIKILYGTASYSLTKSITSTLPQIQSLLTLPNLEANTDYFFKVIATDDKGNSVTSDIFTFQTAEISETPSINLNTLFVTSSDNVLFNPVFLTNKTVNKNILVVPVNSVFAIQFSLDKILSLKKIQAVIRNAKILGFNTSEKVDASSNYVNLIEISPGVYTGKLATPVTTDSYEIYVRLFDYKGNIVEQKIADLNVTNKLSVFKKGTEKQPVENERLLLYIYNKTLRTYQLISPDILPIKNPSYSSPNGTYDLVLPFGQYKAELQGIGYDPQTVIFSIDQNQKRYPIIYLKQQPFNILNTTAYYLSTISDALVAGQDYLRSNSYSNRLFDLSSFGAVLVFIIISTLSISARTHITLFYLPYFLIFKLKILLKGHQSNIIFGKVIDGETNEPISRADISIISKTGEILKKLKTNKLGEFYLQGDNEKEYKIKINKEGFESNSDFAYEKGPNKEFPFLLKIKKIGEKHYSPLWVAYIYFEDFLGICMEALILVGIVIQIYFVFTFGILRVAPFLVLTFLNLILIFTYLYKPKALQD